MRATTVIFGDSNTAENPLIFLPFRRRSREKLPLRFEYGLRARRRSASARNTRRIRKRMKAILRAVIGGTSKQRKDFVKASNTSSRRLQRILATPWLTWVWLIVISPWLTPGLSRRTRVIPKQESGQRRR